MSSHPRGDPRNVVIMVGGAEQTEEAHCHGLHLEIDSLRTQMAQMRRELTRRTVELEESERREFALEGKLRDMKRRHLEDFDDLADILNGGNFYQDQAEERATEAPSLRQLTSSSGGPLPQQASTSGISGNTYPESNGHEEHGEGPFHQGQWYCICGRRYMSKGSRTVHIRHKTEEPQFHCVLCNRHFHELSLLRKHQQRFHAVSYSRYFVCHACGQTFAWYKQVVDHIVAQGHFVVDPVTSTTQ